MQTLRRLTQAQLRIEAQRIRALYPNDLRGAIYVVAGRVIGYFLGLEWLELHVMNTTAPTDYFKNDWATQSRTDAHFIRVIEFADMLFNLQGVDGFDAFLARLRDQRQVEPTAAELESARILRWSDIQFRFVEAGGTLTKDYDIELFLPDGRAVCAETECKIDTTDATEATLANTLKHARKQLPGDRPCAIFMRVPGDWIATLPTMGMELLVSATGRFLRTTGRVVSIVTYATEIRAFGTIAASIIVVKEFLNAAPRFKGSWKLLAPGDEPLWANGGWIKVSDAVQER